MLAFITTADTEILATASAVRRLPEDFPAVRCVNPYGHDPAELIDTITRDHRVIVCRVLGGRRGWPEGVDPLAAACRQRNVTLIALGGEAEPDAQMTALSTAPAGAVAQAGEYLRHGDVDNVEQLLRFLADTFAFTGYGFDAPKQIDELGIYREIPALPGQPTVGFCFYRSHFLTGNTGWVDTMLDAIQAAGAGVIAVWSYNVRPLADGSVPALDLLRGRIDALIVTMLATGGSGAAEQGDWNAGALADLGVPILQAATMGGPRAKWVESDTGLTPFDAATQVAIPEFDGRLFAGVISFKERDPDSPVRAPVPAYVADPERCARVARLAVRHARLAHTPAAERKVAVMLTAFPTKHAKIGMAVGLDTPASALKLFDALSEDGMSVDHDFVHGDELMHALIAAGGHDPDLITDAQLIAAPLRLPVANYEDWYRSLPAELTQKIEAKWGPPPGDQFIDPSTGDFVITGLQLGNVLVAIQPPRGYGEDPVAIYHDPELAPTHHYLACYRFLDAVWGADAIVHLGKHGTLEWLPGKMIGLSEACAPDAAIADIPLIYPFVVNDPGEGVQAKRRAHALIVDHLVPPMMKAGTYDELAELESLLDEYARLEVLDPSKLPGLAAKIWRAIEAANLHADLHLDADAPPEAEDLSALVEHIDGYLCEVKDIQIKDGLHILGTPPEGEQLDGLVAAILEGDPAANPEVLERHIADSTRELDAIVAALNGRFVEAGPSGAPTRGRHDVLPTGRNFYSIDPRALPSELSWEVGQRLADALLEKFRTERRSLPKMVGLVAWGTAAMRTGGDDVAEILALLGVRPTWHPKTKRISGVEAIPLDELKRPRIDVTVRISGFFRDAFPHAIDLIDDAVALVAGLDESEEDNYVRANLRDEGAQLGVAAITGSDPATHPARIFGSKPGTYGAGLMQLIDSEDWRGDGDIAQVYEAWGGYAYGRGRHGEAAGEAMRSAFAKIELAVKNVDSNEHDILDSDDYYQYHGGMVATVRALSGREPAAYLGDSSKPNEVKTRTLAEETRRVFRARVANPRWIASMIRHGYKGAAELSATVDYIFGYDAMTGVAEDWMWEQVAERHLLDPEVAAFMSRSNPWAARAIAEKLLEAADRGMWEAPSEGALGAIRDRYLALEDELEGAAS